ncbi:glycosyltransferase family 2 protein [Methylobacterium sp. J-076]|uniref:glycosyltransferase family 2 protein n=1 Tax=Methylobacterium sp. J-076 TaxID=2836655 RepID=UPI001FBBBC17|nr:glycosyltransferase family 2 protein [Methylobacterium sp. J-076]MCJ2014451.1 glycosyltransferase family 2 protein [Methylobacterium sp. J-076]
MSRRDPTGSGAYLGEPCGAPRSRSAVVAVLRRQPRAAFDVLWAWIMGKRLRARQRLAALIGIDHRIALPASVMARPADDATPAAHPFVLIGEGKLLPGGAERIARAFADDPTLQAIYGDGLVQHRDGGPAYPVLPPAFDPDLLMAVDYLGPVALRPGALPESPPGIAVDAALRIAERHGAGAIGHLPGLLSVRRPAGTPTAARLAAVRAHLDRTGREAATAMLDTGGVIRVTHPLDGTPLVSVIVPTRDRLDLLRPCLASLRARTAWPALEILICDNESREPDTIAFLQAFAGEGRGVVVPCPGAFNFAAMNNIAAAQARGRLLVFMNNDVEAFRPDWLVAMARHALRPEIGAVGAKLLDGAGRIQHGGIVLGTGGLVTHGHRHFPGDAPGYLSTLRTAHRVSAVTAACLMVEADKFRAVGGFDAEAFAVDFNDVDLCLRLNAAGFRTLLAPEAVLHHREAASRRWTDEARARHGREVAALTKRWGPLLVQDPHYHPGFAPDLSTHARLARNFPRAGPVRRPA